MQRALAAVAVCLACGSDPGLPATQAPPPEKVYVCAQEAGVIDVLDGASLQRLTSIPAGEGWRMPHSARVAPDGRTVWITSADGAALAPDEVLVIDPMTDSVIQRIELDVNAFVQHPLVSPDGGVVYVTGFGSSVIYRIDARRFVRLEDIPLPPGASPHGLRLSDDGLHLYVANGYGSIGEIDTATGRYLREFRTPGGVLQVASRGDLVFGSVHSPPTVVRVSRSTGAIDVWPLADSLGIAQIEVSADGSRLYVTEQGSKSGPGLRLLVLGADTGTLLEAHEVGQGPHGVALSEDGRFAYVTGSFDASLTRVELSANQHLAGSTGAGPYGIVLWSAPTGRGP